jgi:hypothetical protein
MPFRVAAVVTLVGIGVVLGGCSSSPSSSSSNTTTSSTAANTTTSTAASTTTTAKAVAANCTQPCADADGFIVQLSSFQYDVSSGNQFITPESGNVFVTVQATFINHAKSSKSATPYDFKLKSAGVEHTTSFIGPCESWSSVDVSPGGSYGPKCLSFQAAAGQPTGIVVSWKPSYFGKSYDIPVS